MLTQDIFLTQMESLLEELTIVEISQAADVSMSTVKRYTDRSVTYRKPYVMQQILKEAKSIAKRRGLRLLELAN